MEGGLIRESRGATGRRVWPLEWYKETCVNPQGPPPTHTHKDTEKELHAAGQLINLTERLFPLRFLTAPAEWTGGGGRAVGASPSAPPAKRLCNGPEEDEVLANCPSLTSLTQT